MERFERTLIAGGCARRGRQPSADDIETLIDEVIGIADQMERDAHRIERIREVVGRYVK